MFEDSFLFLLLLLLLPLSNPALCLRGLRNRSFFTVILLDILLLLLLLVLNF